MVSEEMVVMGSTSVAMLLESCIESSSSSRCVHHLRQIHTQLLINGLLNHPPLLDKLVAAIALSNQPQNLTYAHQILSRSPKAPTVFTLNTMIRAHSKTPTPHKAFHFYHHILHSNLTPDHYTFSFLVSSSSQLPHPGPGLAVHAAAFKRGFDADRHVQSGLIHMYAQFGCFQSARRLFARVRCPDLVTQTAMVSACAGCGDIETARQLFNEMPHRDRVAWNAMISAYAQRGRSREALHLFGAMQAEGARVNEVTMVSVLSACAHLGALDQGRWAHVYIERNGLPVTVALGTALIDMYSKCGSADEAVQVFWRMKDKNVYTWTSVIGGLAMNGAGGTCLELFSLMKEEGVAPNEITFVSVLRGCSVAGLVDEGRRHFDSMRQVYGLEPTPEHYGCLVDLYSRRGRLSEALSVIESMPMKPHVGAWGALLNACRIHKNMELGEHALSKILELETTHDGGYVLLSNMYADSRNWEGVNQVRNMMKIKGTKKEPGCSVIEAGGEVHEFFAGDRSHPRCREIEVMMEEISKKLREAGYVCDTKEVLFDIEEEEKQDALLKHSEKVAIAFGFVSLPDGAPIRIVKNLRVCRDCHDATKVISKVFNREIVLRDRNRFHHFKDGLCSCMDYW